MKRFFKIASLFIVSGGIFMGILLALTQTSAFKNWLGNYVLGKVNQAIAGEIEVARFEGNLFSHLQIDSLTIRHASDTLVFVPRFEAHYSLLSFLKGQLVFDSLIFHSPRFTFIRQKDSSWNFLTIFNAPAARAPHAENGKPFPFSIRIGKLTVQTATVRLLNAPEGIPTRISEISARLSGFYTADSQEVRLNHLTFRSENPDLRVAHVAFRFKRNARQMELRDFALRTSANRLQGAGEYSLHRSQPSRARLETQPFDFSELTFLLPTIRIPARPRILFQADLQKDTLQLHLLLQEKEQRFSLKAEILHPFDFARIRYRLNGKIRNLTLRHWLQSPLPALQGSGDFLIQGSGVTRQTARFELQARLWNLLAYRRNLSRLRVQAAYAPGRLQANLNAQGPYGEAAFVVTVLQPFGVFRFRGKGELNRFNVQTFFSKSVPASNLNSRFFFQGEGLHPETVSGKLAVHLQPSTFAELRIDTFFTALEVERQNFRIDSLYLRSNLVELTSSGQAGLNTPVNLQFKGEIHDPAPALAYLYLPLDTLAARGTFRGTLHGPPDSLQSEVLLNLNGLLVNHSRADSGRAYLHFRWNQPQPLETAEAGFRNLQNGNLTIDSLGGQARLRGKQADLRLHIRPNALLQSTIYAHLFFDSTVQVRIPALQISFKEQQWSGGHPDMAMTINRNSWQFQRIELTAAAPEQHVPQRLFLNGTLNFPGPEDLEIVLSGFRLENFNLFRKDSLPLNGTLDLALRIAGESTNPIIEGNLNVRRATVGFLPIRTLTGEFAYRDEQLTWNVRLKSTPSDSFLFSGQLPALLLLNEKKIRLLPSRPLMVNLTTGKYRLNVFAPLFTRLRNLDGIIVGNLNLHNTLGNPRFGGRLKLLNGRFSLPDLGLDYRQIEGELVGDSTRLRLKHLRVAQTPGSLHVEGVVQANSHQQTLTPEQAVLTLHAEDFPLLNTREYQLQVTSAFLAEIDSSGSRFEGTIRATHFDFYLPPLLGATAKSSGPVQSVPLLVEATRTARPDSFRQATSPLQAANRKIQMLLGTPPLKDFSGTLTITIPENTWLRSPEMRLEIQGEVKLMKEGEKSHLYGQIQVIRGFYNFIGKNFEIRQGKLIFRGEPDFDPEILLETEYQFRTYTHEMRTMKLNVNGRIDELTFNFSLDGKHITQDDAILYILFGRSKEDLLYGDPGTLSEISEGEGNRLLLDVAAGVLSTELTQSIGKELNLDMIEIKSQDNWDKATFVVGKYLTNNLFVSYQREFGANTDDEVTKETIMVEYEIRRNLFLQLLEGNSKTKGMDIIFKFER